MQKYDLLKRLVTTFLRQSLVMSMSFYVLSNLKVLIVMSIKKENQVSH